MATPRPKKLKTQAQAEKAIERAATGRPFGAVEEKPSGISWLSDLKFKLQLRESFLSIPILFLVFYFVGVLLTWLFGMATGFYDPAFVQPLFMAGLVVNGAAAFAQFIAYFYFRSGVHRYIWGVYKPDEKAIVNYSKADFKLLTSWQRLVLSLSVFCFFVLLVVLVYLRLT